MSASIVPIRFVVGSRKLFSIPRVMETRAFTLDDLVGGSACSWPQLAPASDGVRVLSAPLDALATARHHYPSYLITGIQKYERHYIKMDGLSYADYLGKFSSKTRSGFKRKHRRLVEAMDGDLETREFRRVEDVDRFMADALPLSRRTYQARLLDAGLPENAEAIDGMKALARMDELRAYILYGRGKPLSYLYLPTAGATVVYAHLGYDPDVAGLSVGTLLQLDALERLFDEARYRFFDFTEGTGAHKAMFATDSVLACSFLLFRPGPRNFALAVALKTFDGAVAVASLVAAHSGALPRVRALLRGRR